MSSQASTLDCQLLSAAADGNHEEVVELIERGASPNATHDPDAGTPLHAAAKHGHAKVVKRLVQSGAQLDARTSDGSTALHLAAEEGHMEAAAALLAEHAPVDVVDKKGHTPLHAAAEHGNMAMMDLLLEAGAALDAPDSQKLTPLHYACMFGKHLATSQLLAYGAAVDAACSTGLQPLHHAAAAGHLDVIRVLLNANANPNAFPSGGWTPLYLAAAAGHRQVVELLLSSGADPYLPDAYGWLPLHNACVHNQPGVVTCLLDGRSTSAHVNAAGPEGFTPLHRASSRGHMEVVQLLIKAGADVDARIGPSQRTPMHQALLAGHSAVVAALLAAGADPGAVTQSGALGLHLAVMRGYTTIVQQLLAAMAARPDGGGGVDAEYQGQTALHLAIEHGHTDCLQLLLAAGADPNKLYGAAAQEWPGCSPLHRAVLLRRTTALPLLATPANMALVYEGSTPLHRALLLLMPAPDTVQVLVTAGSPAGVTDATGATAMSLAAGSSDAAIRALLPAMLRRECEHYKQLQQDAPQQQQQQPSAVFAAVADALYVDLQAPYTSLEDPAQAVTCFKVVMQVLGAEAGGDLLQQVLGRVATDSVSAVAAATAAAEAAVDRSVPLLLYKVLHTAWLEVMQPLLRQRTRVTNRLQMLVTQPGQPQQQKQGRGRKRQAWGSKAPDSGAWASEQSAHLNAQAVAAAGARQWSLFVQQLDQLTGWYEPSGGLLLKMLEKQLGAPDLTGLCEALLAAWRAAVVGQAGRMQQELADAVLWAVQGAVQQQPQSVVENGGLRKQRRAGGSGGAHMTAGRGQW
jgi:cytohesin